MMLLKLPNTDIKDTGMRPEHYLTIFAFSNVGLKLLGGFPDDKIQLTNGPQIKLEHVC